MTRLPNAPTLGIHEELRWMELDHHGLLRLEVNHGRFVNKFKVSLVDFTLYRILCGPTVVVCVMDQ